MKRNNIIQPNKYFNPMENEGIDSLMEATIFSPLKPAVRIVR